MIRRIAAVVVLAILAGVIFCNTKHTPAPAVATAVAPPALPGRSEASANASKAVHEAGIPIYAKRYRANISAERGLVYEPLEVSGGEPPQFGMKLSAIQCGAAPVFAPAGDAARAAWRDAKTGEIVLAHGAVEERYTVRADGIEQRFLIADRPAGAGALTFTSRLAVTGLSPLPSRLTRGGGIQFAHDGKFAVRYGQVMVRDAARHALTVEPKLSADGYAVCFEIPERFVRNAVFPLEVDPLVGADFVVSPDNPTGVGAPTISPGVNNYLIAWDDFTAGPNTPQLVAAIVSSSAVVSPPITLTNTQTTAPLPYRLQRIESAFDGTNWIVVWAQDTATGSAIHGAIISSGASTTITGSTIPPAGTVLNNADFEIAQTTGTVQEDPLVVYNGTDFLVAWTTGASTTSPNAPQIFYARVGSDGTVSTVSSVGARTNPPNQALYLLAPQLPSGDVLMIYRENAETPTLTRGVRIAPDGTQRDQGGISLFLQDEATGGFGNPIGAAFINSEWQVLSTYDQTTDSSVFLHHVSTSGTVTPPTGVFAVVGLGPTGTTTDSFQPAFAGTSSWLFPRNEKVNNTVYHILAKRVGFDGADLDPIPVQVDTATQGILRNAVAAQSGTQYLVTWLDGRRATTQPGDAHNIAAAFVDATVADTNGPALKPVATASPTSGAAPLSVSFDASTSTGSFDSLAWTFGDGTSSNSATVSHTYTKDGIYIAELALAKGAYVVSQSIVISVGTSGQLSGSGTQVGVPVTDSTGLVSSLLVSSAGVALDFTSQNDDATHVTGIVDLGVLPKTLTGTTGSVLIGTQTYQFTLDAKGQFTSDASQLPVFSFAVSPSSGAFTLTTSKDNLQNDLANYGAQDATTKPPIIVNVPITLAIGTFSATSTVGLQYTATAAKSGTATYSFLKKGQTVSGSFIITKFSAKESGPASSAVHTYTIQGELVRPNGLKYTPSPTGQFTISIGNASLSLPAGLFIGNGKGDLKFKARKGATGLKTFQIQAKSGVFSMQVVGLPSGGTGGTGLPISSGNDDTTVDLNLSLQFALDDGEFDAGRFIFITRKSASAKSWTLR